MPVTRPRHYTPNITEDEKTLSSREYTTEWVSYALIPDSVTLIEKPDRLIFEFGYPVREKPEESKSTLESGAEIQTGKKSQKLLKVIVHRHDRLEARLARLPDDLRQFGSERDLDSVKRSYEIASRFFEAAMDEILTDLRRTNGTSENTAIGDS